MSALSPLRRIALLCAMLLALTPPPSAHAEAPAYWPYQTLTRGAASRDDLHVNGRGPSIVVLRDAEALRAFWAAAHRYHDTHVDVDVSVRPPNVDFERRMAVAVIGRSGSDTVHVQKMWTLPQEMLVAGLFNGRWPDIPTSPDRVPYELIVMPRTTRKLVTFERPTAVRLHALIARFLAPLPTSDAPRAGGGRGPASTEIRALADASEKRAHALLQTLDRLPQPRHEDPDEPYYTLLRAAINDRLADRAETAGKLWRQACALWNGTRVSRLASSRLATLARRPRDLESERVLDAARQELAGQPQVTEGHARRWCDLAQQYEYLTSRGPVARYVAARCYVEASRDPNDADAVQTALLRAATLYEAEFDATAAVRLCWACVNRYPDADAVPRVLKRIGRIEEERGRKNATASACRAFLARWPLSRNSAAVRKTLTQRGAPTAGQPQQAPMKGTAP